MPQSQQWPPHLAPPRGTFSCIKSAPELPPKAPREMGGQNGLGQERSTPSHPCGGCSNFSAVFPSKLLQSRFQKESNKATQIWKVPFLKCTMRPWGCGKKGCSPRASSLRQTTPLENALNERARAEEGPLRSREAGRRASR